MIKISIISSILRINKIFILKNPFFALSLFAFLIRFNKEVWMDLIYIGIIVVFFGLTWLLVRLAEKVM
jgi:hypothetical protein